MIIYSNLFRLLLFLNCSSTIRTARSSFSPSLALLELFALTSQVLSKFLYSFSCVLLLHPRRAVCSSLPGTPPNTRVTLVPVANCFQCLWSGLVLFLSCGVPRSRCESSFAFISFFFRSVEGHSCIALLPQFLRSERLISRLDCTFAPLFQHVHLVHSSYP